LPADCFFQGRADRNCRGKLSFLRRDRGAPGRNTAGFTRSGASSALALRLQLQRSMWRFVSLFAVSFAAAPGCDSPRCDELELVVSSPTAEPGELRTALRLVTGFPDVAVRPDGGMVCVTCTGLHRLDADLRDDGRIGSMKEPRSVAIGPDGTIYTTAQIPGEDELAYEVIAFDAAGRKRWRAPLVDPETGMRHSPPGALAANAEHVYLSSSSSSSSTIAFDAASGAGAWSIPDQLLGVSHEGIFVAQGKDTVAHLDRTGAAIWRRPMKGQDTLIDDAVVTPDGGAIIVGHGGVSVDLGDRVLQASSGQLLRFIVELDPAGAVRWAYKIDNMTPKHVALTESGEIILAGDLDCHRSPQSCDAFLAVATPEKVVRLHRIGGIGHQDLEGLQVSMDGTAWLQVGMRRDPIFGDPDRLDMTIEVGSHQLDEIGTYVLGIVP
jgi:hypothetical protein